MHHNVLRLSCGASCPVSFSLFRLRSCEHSSNASFAYVIWACGCGIFTGAFVRDWHTVIDSRIAVKPARSRAGCINYLHAVLYSLIDSVRKNYWFFSFELYCHSLLSCLFIHYNGSLITFSMWEIVYIIFSAVVPQTSTRNDYFLMIKSCLYLFFKE
jgi:hypothetical protein